jgi:hypothetical protein
MRLALIVGLLVLGACSSSHPSARQSPTTVSAVRGNAGVSETIPPRLRLSATAGSAGTHIEIAATGCSAVPGQVRSVFWHDAYNTANPKQAGDRGLVALARRQVGVASVDSGYVVTAADPSGKSVIVVECGGVGNAEGYFTVTR